MPYNGKQKHGIFLMRKWISGIACVLTLSALSSCYADDCVTNVIQKRHSGNNFDTTKSIAMPDLLTLLEAARMAPSAQNMQPWFYTIYQRDQNSAGYQKILQSIPAKEQSWAKNAPILISISASSDAAHKDRFAQFDTGSATMSLMLQATSLGIMTHAIGSFQPSLPGDLTIPETATLICLLAVGYPDAEETITTKDRKPLKDNFFMEQWGNGISS